VSDYWPRTYACMQGFTDPRPDGTACTLPSGHKGNHRYGEFRTFALPEEDPCNPNGAGYVPPLPGAYPLSTIIKGEYMVSREEAAAGMSVEDIEEAYLRKGKRAEAQAAEGKP